MGITTSVQLQALLLSQDPGDQAKADAELDRILRETPEINPGFEMPEIKGVVRYDSEIQSVADVARMCPYLQRRIAQARSRNPIGRLTITQTATFPDDTIEDRRNLIAARYGLRLVVSS